MRILFDQGTPVPLRRFLSGHSVETVHERGWSRLSNGELISVAVQERFEVLVTTDQNLEYQQNLKNQRIAVIVLTKTSWRLIQRHVEAVVSAIDSSKPGDFKTVPISR